MKAPRMPDDMLRILDANRRRQAERVSVMNILKAAAPRVPASVQKKYLEKHGITLPSKTELKAKQVAHEKLKRKIQATLNISPRKPGRMMFPPPDPDPFTDPTFPFCMTSAWTCWAQDGSCNAEQGIIKLRNQSSGLGGAIGWEAVPSIPPLTGSLFYVVKPPIDGTLSCIAEVSLTGMITCIDNITWGDGSELPNVYANAKLVLRLIAWNSNAFQEQVIQTVHSQGYPGNIATFNDDVYVVIVNTPCLPNQVLIELRAELYAEGVSDYASADVDFESGGFGIRMAAMCFSFAPYKNPF